MSIDDDGGLSGSNDNEFSSEEKQGLSIRMNLPWEPIDKQHLLAYKKEVKSWDWIFKKFSGRTPPAVRTRWTIAQRRVR